MNIFITYPCPVKSARFLDNIRANKMIVESCQILSTAIILNGGKATYKLSHKNHPVCIWASQSRGNYDWLLRHLRALIDRFNKRTGKIHGCEKVLLELTDGAKYIPDTGLTEFVNCTGGKNFSFKHISDTHLAYRLYLRSKWKNDKIKLSWS